MGPLFAAVPVPDKVHRRDRRRRLSRQEVRRLGRRRPKPTASISGKWIGIPVAATGGLINYRIAALEKAGFKEFPKDLAGFLGSVKGLNKNGTPAGMALGHASGDANGWLHWALWAHGGNLVDKDNKVIDQLAGNREGARIRQGALRQLHSGHRVVERLVEQQGVPGRPAASHRQRHLGLCDREEGSPGDRRGHEPRASAGRPRTASRRELHLGFPMLIFNFTKYPAGLQGVHGVHDGAGAVQSVGRGRRRAICRRSCYAFDNNPIWTADPKNTPYRDVASDAHRRRPVSAQMGENAAAAIADFVVVDMFANYCTGREDVKGAMASAERAAKRIFRG